MSTSTGGPRIEGLVAIITVATTAGLLFAVVSSLRTTEQALEMVDRGSAASVMTRVQQQLRKHKGPPTEQTMQAILQKLEPMGLRYVALGGSTSGLRVQAGQARLTNTAPKVLARAQDRVRLSAELPPPPEGRPSPRHGPPDGRRPPTKHRPPAGYQRFSEGPPTLTIEVHSALSEGLMRDAQAATLAGVLACLLLLLAGPAIVYLLRQRRRLEVARANEAQLAALGQMSAVIAHEIKNPLASLKGNAQLLAERLKEPKNLSKATRVVHEAQRLEGLVRGLLEFLQSRRINTQPTEVNHLVQLAVDGMGEASARVELRPLTRDLKWSLDPERMNQVLSNLIRNALEASAEGPTQVSLQQASSALTIEVSDRGPGLPPDQNVFEPFVTTKIHGTGLGLSVARTIVEAHGGQLTAHPNPEGGTIIRVRLPQ